MLIEFRLTSAVMPASLHEDDDEESDYGDIRYILRDVCGALQSHAEFIVSGFGEERWPLDISTDFAVFVERLPEVLRQIRHGAAAELSFHEQGVERGIWLTPNNGSYTATCESHSLDWQPGHISENLERQEVVEMLTAALNTFMRAFAAIAPELVDHQTVRVWLQ
jgi:hypothetical protein